MTNLHLEENYFFKYLKSELSDQLLKWVEPNWLVCVPKTFIDLKLTYYLAASQALFRSKKDRLLYQSEFCGSSIKYEVCDDEPRKIIWQEEKNNEVLISCAIILDEYLMPINEHVVHVLLIDRFLPSMIEDDESFLSQNEPKFITSCRDAKSFLRNFRCHIPVLEDLQKELEKEKITILSLEDVDHIQCFLHGLILKYWEFLIKRHIPLLQTDSCFQDTTFQSLDFIVESFYHNEIWRQVVDRCQIVDKMVSTRVSYLKSCEISPMQLGVSTEYYTRLPAAVVELASLNARSCAIERLHCIRDSLELIEAQTKEAKAMVYQFKDSGNDTNTQSVLLTQEDLIALMTVVIVEAQCLSLVANIYYMTHYIFSISDEAHPLWQSLSIFRKCLEKIMKLDITNLPDINHPIRKELSLQDLMQVSFEVESRFESPHNKEGSHSTSDITALDIQLQQLTQRIAQSTQALSETTLSARNSPSRRSDKSTTTVTSMINNSQSKMQSFVEFLSSIPSTIRASFRRRQDEHRSAIHSSLELET